MMMTDELANHAWLVEGMRLRGEAYLAEKRFDEAAKAVNEALRRLDYPERRRGF